MTTNPGSAKPYPDVPQQPRYPEIEMSVLAFWEKDRIFQRSVEERAAGPHGANEFVFYDGPPFANGLPHYGHLLTGYVKDIVPRYQTMRGKRVERRFGWDCHGLPAEMESEKELKISGRQQITAFGIDKFNAHCRSSVMRYTGEWRSYVTRQARWVDFDRDYKTMDLSYMESVLWAFKQLWDKGLLYESYRVMPYSWAVETPLSNFETRLDNAYRPRQDPAVTIGFDLVPLPGEPGPQKLLIWTTTPWTLPANLAAAVGPEIEYVKVALAGVVYVLGAAALSKYAKELEGHEVVGTMLGKDLVGRRYAPLFPFFKDHENAFVVLGGDFVSTEDGTGVVHMAPGFGEDDQKLCEQHGIKLVCPIDQSGKYTAEVPDWAGMNVLEANKPIIVALKQRGVLLRHETITHNYPHCWRTDTPLIYRAVSSWYVRVSSFKDRMVELNQQVRWIPEHIKDGQFGNWIANARDWSISRNRFWGAPIPIWKSDDPRYPRLDVYGSITELERDFGVKVTDLHRPFIDSLVRKNPDDPTGKSMMRRVEDVLDCWFESGSMPFAQVHYPFENRDWFDTHNPGDFIVEYIGQTRGWFYTLHVLSTALFDRPSFRTCVSHGIVQGDDGQKMSKSLNNYADPMAMFDTYGSDAMRWYLLSSPILRGTDMIVNEEGSRDAVRQVMLPIWNSWYFLSLYANAAKTQGVFRTEGNYSTDVLDRYILAKMHDLVASLTTTMDEYDLFAACASVRAFLDALTNWYVRRSRDRFWAGDQDAIDTLHTVLSLLCRALAPLLPLTTEAVYQPLTGERSVHLTDWPSADSLPADPALVEAMDLARDVCSSTLRLRKSNQMRVRQPLAMLQVAVAGADRLAPFRDLIADEVNVKAVDLTEDVASVATFDLQVVPAGLGPRLGDKTQHVIKAVKSGDWQHTVDADGTNSVVAGGIDLREGEYALKLVVQGDGASTPMSTNGGVVVLDTALTAELTAEGVTRDLIRLVQQARRDAGLQVSDRIALTLGVPESVRRQVVAFQHLLTEATLATSLTWGSGETAYTTDAELDGDPIHIGLQLVADR